MSNPLKKTMVFLGLAEEDLEEGETPQAHAPQPAAAAPAPAPRAVPQQPKTNVTPLRKATPARQPVAQAMNEILTVHPTEYREAAVIAESFRDGVPVILNLSRMNDAEAKRLIDFASGLSMGLRGRIERVTTKVFLLSPEHVAVSGDEQPRGESGSFFVSPA
jgi:cell division inhibitor SepF